MILNLAQAGAAQINDLPDDDLKNFICTNPAFATAPIVLAKGERFEGTLNEQGLTLKIN